MKVLERQNPDVAKLTPYEPGRPIEAVAREYGLNPDDIIKLASNESAIGTSPKAIAAIQKAASEMFLYPDGGGIALRTGLAARFGLTMDEVILGNGSNELLELVGHAFLRPGHGLACSERAFVVYRLLARMFGAPVVEAPMREGFVHNLDALADALTPETAVVIICNPNNPTSTMVGQAEVDRFMARVPDSTLVVFDEAYAEICLGEMPDTLKYVREGRACLVLRTFSKAYGLAGLRIGFGLGPKALLAALEKPRQPFNTSRMAQIAALAALDDDAFVAQGVEVYREARRYVQGELDRMGLRYVPAYANFILIEVGDGLGLTKALQREGVIVRPMGGYALPQWIRVTFGRPDQNQRFIRTLEALLR